MRDKKRHKRLFTTESVDDEIFMSADLHINSTFKNGVEFEFERQNGAITIFTLYRGGMKELNEFLTLWLKDNP